MLSKALKLDLRSQQDFFRTAQRFSTESFLLYWKNQSKLQFQVVISRGAAQNAVERNALKRSVYDICAEILPSYQDKNLAVVILVKKKRSYTWLVELKRALEKVMQSTE